MHKTCDEFRRLAKRTWDRLRVTTGGGVYTTLSEPSITEDILLELAVFNSNHVRLYKTSQKNEPKQGTDWEFFIGRNERWIRYAIQAKKIDLKTGKYDRLDHKVPNNKQGKLQLEILKEYATANDAVPLYCFYNYVQNKNGMMPPHMHRHHHCCPCPCCYRDEPSQFGITITPLHVVEPLLQSSRKKDRTFGWIHSQHETHPWKCLVCCEFCFSHEYFWHELGLKKKPKIYKSLPKFIQQERLEYSVVTSLTSEALRSPEMAEFYSKDYGIPKNIAIIDLSDSD